MFGATSRISAIEGEVSSAARPISQSVWVVSGFCDLVVLKSTGSEFKGFLKDEYTTLQETDDRIMATSLTARWRITDPALETDWDGMHAEVVAAMLERFANLHSLALQQTLWEMGRAALEAFPAIAEIRLVAPNKHHFLVDLGPFGLPNPGEVFHADDRPYGLIEASAVREGAPDAGTAWYGFTGLV